MRPIKSFVIVLLVLVLFGCTKYEYHETRNVHLNTVSQEAEMLLAEDLLLDVGVAIFDPGKVDLDTNETDYSSVRQSESVWITQQIKNTLEQSNAWGIVRVLPIAEQVLDLTVQGTIISSNGEILELEIAAVDSSGMQWLSKVYTEQASQYAYNPEVDLPSDPFSGLFSRFANDLFEYQKGLSDQSRRTIRAITKINFAKDFLPEAFEGYLQSDQDGTLSLLREPAVDDPYIKRVEMVQDRNALFIDVIQEYYRTFNKRMSAPYNEWRKLSYREVLYARQLKEQARRERAASLLAMAGGLAAASYSKSRTGRIAGHVGTIYGASLFALSYQKEDKALSHNDQLRELSKSLEQELEPSILELQDRTVTLTGTVQDQYAEWKKILADIYRLEEGVHDKQVDAPSNQ